LNRHQNVAAYCVPPDDCRLPDLRRRRPPTAFRSVPQPLFLTFFPVRKFPPFSVDNWTASPRLVPLFLPSHSFPFGKEYYLFIFICQQYMLWVFLHHMCLYLVVFLSRRGYQHSPYLFSSCPGAQSFSLPRLIQWELNEDI